MPASSTNKQKSRNRRYDFFCFVACGTDNQAKVFSSLLCHPNSMSILVPWDDSFLCSRFVG